MTAKGCGARKPRAVPCLPCFHPSGVSAGSCRRDVRAERGPGAPSRAAATAVTSVMSLPCPLRSLTTKTRIPRARNTVAVSGSSTGGGIRLLDLCGIDRSLLICEPSSFNAHLCRQRSPCAAPTRPTPSPGSKPAWNAVVCCTRDALIGTACFVDTSLKVHLCRRTSP
jgi:hypothetical protein